jgi:hypothetical protein
MENKIMYADLMNGFQIKWSVKNIGWGEFYFYNKDENIHCSNELMSKEFIKSILNNMVDNCILDNK